jgi:HEAT repeat protein
VRRAAAALLATALAACSPAGQRDLSSGDPARRAAAVERLGDPRDPRELAALLVAQQDPHPRVRAAAARALGQRGGTRSLEALSAMLGDPDPEVVSSAARALATLRPDRAPSDARGAAEVAERAGRALAQAYGRADSRGRNEIAQALRSVGTSLREAVEAEARQLWEQNLRELRSGSTTGRAGAAEELGRSGRAEAVKLLVPLLEGGEGEPQLAAAAARGLGGSGDRTALEPLEAALRSRWAGVAEAAAWALGNLGDPLAAEGLGDVGSSGPSRVARSAVAALDALPPAPGIGVSLCEVALRAQDPAVTEAAAAAARSRGGDCPERPLVQRLARGGAESLAPLAAFGALGLPADRARGAGEKATALLGSSPDPRVRAAAARALGTAPFPSSVPALQRRLAAVQERAARGARGGDAPGLAEAGDVEELAEVTVALARLAPESSMALATRLVSAEDPRLRGAAARALAVGREPASLPHLVTLSVDPDAGVRRAAYAGLGPRGPAAVAPLGAALSRHLGDPDEAEVIVGALGATGDPSALPVLSPLLGGPMSPGAALAIGRLGSPGGVTVLLAALAGGGTVGRLETVEALTHLGLQEAAEPLATELLCERPAVRAAAARGLGKLRYEPASIRLEALRSDYFVEVRRAAREALARLPARPVRKP